MADFAIAFKKLEGFEDSTLSGKITKDEGGRTRFGVAEKFHPELSKSGFFGAMSHDDALAVATGVAKEKYWNPIHGDELVSQDVANKLLDMAYNMGVTNCAHYAQDCCLSTFGAALVVDNSIGEKTVAALNAIDEVKLCAALRQFQLKHYSHLRDVRPVSESEWMSWMRRMAS